MEPNERLVYIRKQLNLSQSQVEEQADVANNFLTRIENGHSSIPFNLIRFYVEKGANPYYILSGKGEPMNQEYRPPAIEESIAPGQQTIQTLSSRITHIENFLEKQFSSTYVKP